MCSSQFVGVWFMGLLIFFFFSYGRVNIQVLGCAVCEWMVLGGGLLGWFALVYLVGFR